MNGRQIFKFTLYDYEGYVLAVYPDGGVTA
jgi:hypothetical protein